MTSAVCLAPPGWDEAGADAGADAGAEATPRAGAAVPLFHQFLAGEDLETFEEARVAVADPEENLRDLTAWAMVRLARLVAWEERQGVPDAAVDRAFYLVFRLLKAGRPSARARARRPAPGDRGAGP